MFLLSSSLVYRIGNITIMPIPHGNNNEALCLFKNTSLIEISFMQIHTMVEQVLFSFFYCDVPGIWSDWLMMSYCYLVLNDKEQRLIKEEVKLCCSMQSHTEIIVLSINTNSQYLTVCLPSPEWINQSVLNKIAEKITQPTIKKSVSSFNGQILPFLSWTELSDCYSTIKSLSMVSIPWFLEQLKLWRNKSMAKCS